MPYSKEVFTAAEAKLSEKRQKAESENAFLKSRLYNKIPRLKEIEDELAETGIRVAREILANPVNVTFNIEKLKKSNLSLQAERAELLTANGYAPDLLETQYSCAKCRDTGIVDGKLCGCFKAVLKEEACRIANLGSPLPLSSFDTFDVNYYPDEKFGEHNTTIRSHMKEVLTCCRLYAENFETKKENLLLLGPTGLGKTHLALSIANKAAERGLGIIYDTAQNIFGKMEDEQFGRSEKKYTPMLFECDLLVIDDLGAEFASAFNVTALYNIINTRILAKKPMVVSTNLKAPELSNRYNDRIYSRLMWEFSILTFYGNDIRRLKLN